MSQYLNKIRSLTFLLEDNDDLISETHQLLKSVKDRMGNNLPLEKGLPSLFKKKTKQNKTKQKQKKRKRLKRMFLLRRILAESNLVRYQ